MKAMGAPQNAGKVVEEPSPEAATLAVDIVIDSFGQETGTVCRSLIRRGQRTLRELVRDTVRERGGVSWRWLAAVLVSLPVFLHFFSHFALFALPFFSLFLCWLVCCLLPCPIPENANERK